MEKIDLVCRYLKARQSISKNAGVLADYIENKKNIDAVELDMKNLDSSKNILSNLSDMTFYLMEINEHLILIFPEEEREKYMNIQLELMSGDVIDEYRKFTYSEANAAKDFLQAADVTYRSSIDSDGRIKFMVPRKYSDVMENAIRTIQDEVKTKEGMDYYNVQNICYMNAIHQLSQAVSYDGVSFIGKEGGTDGVRIDNECAIYANTKGTGKIIFRDSPQFEQELQKIVLNELNGTTSPVKAFYGDFAEEITKDITKKSAKEPAMTKKDVLSILALNDIPDIEAIGKMINDIDKYDDEKKRAVRVLVRMSVCRMQKQKDLQKYKQRKPDRDRYLNIHSDNIKKFEHFDVYRQNRRETDER